MRFFSYLEHGGIPAAWVPIPREGAPPGAWPRTPRRPRRPVCAARGCGDEDKELGFPPIVRGYLSTLFPLLLLPFSCSVGDGSEIDPALRRPTGEVLAGFVLDASGTPVVSAEIRMHGRTLPVTASNRVGRFRLENPIRGDLLLSVDGRGGSADGTDRLPFLRFRLHYPGGEHRLSLPVVLPDLNAGSGSTLDLGVLPGARVLDDGPNSGGRLDLAAGTAIGLEGAVQGIVRVDLVGLPKTGFPRPLPPPSTGARLAGAPLLLSPITLSFGSGARLQASNDLGLPAGGKARLYRLDPYTGTWKDVGGATVETSGGKLVQDQALLPGGGLYVFAVNVAVTGSLTGVVRDTLQRPLARAVVTVQGGFSALTDAAGRFRVDGLPLRDGGGGSPTLAVRILAPFDHAPKLLDFSVSMDSSSVDAGAKDLDTWPVGSMRFLTASRGRSKPWIRVEVGSASGFGMTVTADAAGKGVLHDLPYGMVASRISWIEAKDLFAGFNQGRIDGRDPLRDLLTLAGPKNLRPAEFRGRMSATLLDEDGGGPLSGAILQGRADANTGDKGTSDENGRVFVGGERGGVSTAAFESSFPGSKKVVAARSLVLVDHNSPEFPLAAAHRPPLGNFDPFARLRGSLTGAALVGKEVRILVRGALDGGGWRQEVLSGSADLGRLPRFVEPGKSGSPPFDLGIPPGRASVTAVLGTESGGVFLPERLGLLGDLVASAGNVLSKDLDLSFPLDKTIGIRGIRGLDPSLNSGAYRYLLAARRKDGSVLTLLPESGGITVSGGDLTLRVPDRNGPLLGGAAFLCAVKAGGSAPGGADFFQQIFVESNGSEAKAPSFLAVPFPALPAAGSKTPSADFVDVRWTPPPGAHFQTLEIESEGTADRLVWRVLLPGDRGEFRFGDLVPEAPNPLKSGRTYVMTLKAYRYGSGSILRAFQDSYQRILGNLQSFRFGDMEIEAVSGVTQSFTLP